MFSFWGLGDVKNVMIVNDCLYLEMRFEGFKTSFEVFSLWLPCLKVHVSVLKVTPQLKTKQKLV